MNKRGIIPLIKKRSDSLKKQNYNISTSFKNEKYINSYLFHHFF